MRFIIGIVAALMVLGLAAFGLVSQREMAPSSLAASNSRGTTPPDNAASATTSTTTAQMAQGAPAAPHALAPSAAARAGQRGSVMR